MYTDVTVKKKKNSIMVILHAEQCWFRKISVREGVSNGILKKKNNNNR